MSTCEPQKLMHIDDNGRQTFNQHLLQYIQDHDDISIQTFLPEINEKSGISGMVDAFGKTLLHYAIECKNDTITKTLIDSGCDIHAVDNVGQTPLLIALEKRYMNILHLLARKVSEVYIDEDIGRKWLRIILADSEWNTRTCVVLFPKMKVKRGGSTELANILMAEKCDLCYAICMKNSAVAKIMVDQGTSIEAKDMKGNTALHYAVSLGFTENVKLLLELGVNVNVQNNNGDIALFWAIHFKHSEHVKMLLESDTDVNFQNGKSNTALHLAVCLGQVEIVKLLLEHNADVNVQNESGDTPLHIVAHVGNIEFVKLLLERDANANTLNIKNYTPLHLAVYSGCTENLELLLKHGADVNIKDATGKTALHLAARLKQADNVKLLLEYNANENTRNEKGLTPLHLAAHFGPIENVNLLLERGANVDVKDNSGNTVLHLAARSGNSETVKLLLDHGVDVNVQDNKGNTALHLAARFEHFETAKLLLERGANVNVQNSKHKIAMNHSKYLYTTVQQQEILKLLVDNGSDLILLDKSNKWQMCNVLKNGPKEAVEILLNTNAIFLVRSHTQKTVAHHLVKNLQPGVYELLYNRDFDVNARDQFGRTPLHCAAKAANEVACRVLLDKGAEVNAAYDGSLGIPLVYALLYVTPTSNKQCIDLLLEHGANVQFVIADSRTAIDLLTVHNLPEVTETVLGHIALLQFRGTAIIELISQKIAANEAYKTDYEFYKSQLETMKTESVVGGITLFKLLTENERRVTVYMRNEELLVKIQSFQSNYHSNSYCNKQFDKRITDAIELAKLIKEAEAALYQLINSRIKFNSYIVYEIVRYLDRKDLVNIINM